MSDAPPAFHELDDAAQQRALAILVDVGTSLVLECKAPDTAPLPERANAFERAATAIRRTILLSRHIAQNAAQNAILPPVSPEARRTRARKEIIRAVEDTIEQKAAAADAPALRLELVDRLDSPDFAEDLAHRSPADLIHELCNDLGLAFSCGRPLHRRRTPADIALLCFRAAQPGTDHSSPLPDPFCLPEATGAPPSPFGLGAQRAPAPG